ncbi:hypothetical protein QN360_21615, partial [Glaciimonas sp. CA11.2]|nr:hypothetical protein [Glaciimonas sp. CA11.2]
VWWPENSPVTPPDSLLALLQSVSRVHDASEADVILLAPLGRDLSTTVADLQLDPSKAVAIDPLFSGKTGVTLMVSPGTAAATVD